ISAIDSWACKLYRFIKSFINNSSFFKSFDPGQMFAFTSRARRDGTKWRFVPDVEKHFRVEVHMWNEVPQLAFKK
ncbi:Protein of unknown function, partial [Gryllus bimaculatus]